MNDEKQERLIELLTERTLFGLNEQESAEMAQLKKQFPDVEKDVSLELAAAKISLTAADASEELPANLRADILAAADDYFSGSKQSPNVFSFPVKSNESIGAPVNSGFGVSIKSERQWFWQWFGWGVAALACLALAINLWSGKSARQDEIAAQKPETVQTPTPELTAAQKREQLMRSAGDLVQLNWTAPTDEKRILGDIVWSNERQAGFMRFRGLPPNDPNREAYQLWIVDETQNPKTPISGGVFQVNQDGEAIVPINAQIQVKKPKAFAVTKEKPGGVVVSTQKEFMAVAKI